MRTKRFKLTAVILTVLAAMLITACPNPFIHEETPDAPREIYVKGASSGSITITWSPVSGAIGYIVYRSTSDSGAYTQITDTPETSYTDSDLSAGTAYYYKIAAYSEERTSKQSAVFSAFTRPAIPTGLNAAVVTSSSSITITWSSVFGATGYYVYRSLSESGDYTKAGEATSSAFTDSGLAGYTTYYYIVSAYNSAGEGIKSDSQVWARTRLGTPTEINTTANSSENSITISWAAEYGADGYYIYYRSSSESNEIIQTRTSLTTSYTDSDLPAGTHYYKVAAFNAEDTSSESSDYSVIILGAPSGFNKTSAAPNSVTISWSSILGATGYDIYCSLSESGPYTLIGTSTTNSYTDSSGLSPYTAYYYKVSASNTADTGSQSAFFMAKTSLDTPTGVTTTGISANSVTVNWNAVYGATNYYIYRSESSSGTYTKVGETNSISFTDSCLAGYEYYYKVEARDGVEFGSQSSHATVTTPSILSAPQIMTIAATSLTITIYWDPYTDSASATGYYIYRSSSLSGTYTLAGTSTETKFKDTGLSIGTTYYYKVAAYNSFGKSAQSSAVFQQTQSSSTYEIAAEGIPRAGDTITVTFYGTGWLTTEIQWGYCETATGTFTPFTTSYTNISGSSSITIPQYVTVGGQTVNLKGKYIRAFRRHNSGDWSQVNNPSIRSFASNFIGPIQ